MPSAIFTECIEQTHGNIIAYQFIRKIMEQNTLDRQDMIQEAKDQGLRNETMQFCVQEEASKTQVDYEITE